LFSAVLTAFLIESYKNLQVDKADVTIQLLQQIATKGTVISSVASSPSDSVSPLPSVSDFQVPKWAIRINVLWFISLLCSVSVGSFGMLVKQWLHEYLAVEPMSAPTRLRERVIRKQALRDWRVLEVAAVLPLVLQIALLLFFVGMCYFTASVQKSISFASIPLVSGWAFIFLCTILAPLLWPRCPFRVLWLNKLPRYSRFRVVAWAFSVIFTSAKDSSKDEERQDKKKDIDPFGCLLLVDETMRDDGLLEAICEAYELSLPSPSSVILFVSALLKPRLGKEYIESPSLRGIPDFRSLAIPCWRSVTDLVANTLVKQLADEPVYERAGLTEKADAMLILLARSPGQLSDTGKDAINACMAHRTWDDISSEIARRQQGDFIPIARPLLDAYGLLPPIKAMELYLKLLCPSKMNHQHPGSPGLLNLLVDTKRHPHVFTEHPDIINDLFTVLGEIMIKQVENLAEGLLKTREGSSEAFIIIWEFWEQSGHRDAALELALKLWTSARTTALLFIQSTAMHRPYRISTLATISREIFKASTLSGELIYSADLGSFY
jgi:hypothetical protein